MLSQDHHRRQSRRPWAGGAATAPRRARAPRSWRRFRRQSRSEPFGDLVPGPLVC